MKQINFRQDITSGMTCVTKRGRVYWPLFQKILLGNNYFTTFIIVLEA
jgi:hypothetical protein